MMTNKLLKCFILILIILYTQVSSANASKPQLRGTNCEWQVYGTPVSLKNKKTYKDNFLYTKVKDAKKNDFYLMVCDNGTTPPSYEVSFIAPQNLKGTVKLILDTKKTFNFPQLKDERAWPISEDNQIVSAFKDANWAIFEGHYKNGKPFKLKFPLKGFTRAIQLIQPKNPTTLASPKNSQTKNISSHKQAQKSAKLATKTHKNVKNQTIKQQNKARVKKKAS